MKDTHLPQLTSEKTKTKIPNYAHTKSCNYSANEQKEHTHKGLLYFFSMGLNLEIVGACFITFGRLFHILAPWYWKERRPCVTLFTFGCISFDLSRISYVVSV